ncbi:hypothetical protein LTR37_001601 [Vermiconidia calcicola]|uniref:Uncharacterized protein n=1 Tax=Vermiconidia calcicola TaxID=1690605 RepID=A0ACC3NVA9_9PEZI|nr:hypothetical protein LTR37_001601 [Vermiconidia calcicola]
MAPTLWTKKQTSALVMLAIKLEGVKKDDLTGDEQARDCYICHEALVSSPRKPKSKQIVRLHPCECLFHKDCIMKHALVDMVVEDIRVDGILNEGELAAIPGDQEEAILLHHDEEAAAPGMEWENETDEHGNQKYMHDPTMIKTCPIHRDDHHIFPCEADYDFNTQWTRAEIPFAKAFFADFSLTGALHRNRRSKESIAFARDLRAAKRAAETKVSLKKAKVEGGDVDAAKRAVKKALKREFASAQ